MQGEMAEVTDPETHPADCGIERNCGGEMIPADLQGETLLHDFILATVG